MIGVAACGAGSWGRNLVRNFATRSDARLLYVVDIDPAVREAMLGLYPNASITAELDDALRDPDVAAVVVSADAPHHYRLARAALDAGKHTFVEKPLTLCSSDAEDLIRVADSKGLKLMVGHLMQYHPAVTAMKQMITDGDFNPLYAYFQRINLGVIRMVENAWWSLAPHDISMACFLFDDEPVSVAVAGHSYVQPDIEDVVFAILHFRDGRMAHIHVSWLDPHKMRKVTLVGSDKMVVFDDMEASEKMRIYDKGAELVVGSGHAESIAVRSGEIRIPPLPATEPLALECQHFLDAIANDAKPLSDGRDGLRVVRVLEAGSASLARGGVPVSIGETEPSRAAGGGHAR